MWKVLLIIGIFFIVAFNCQYMFACIKTSVRFKVCVQFGFHGFFSSDQIFGSYDDQMLHIRLILSLSLACYEQHFQAFKHYNCQSQRGAFLWMKLSISSTYTNSISLLVLVWDGILSKIYLSDNIEFLDNKSSNQNVCTFVRKSLST